ncbi:MAG: response regulator [Cellulosilyticaceae bacterium]
MFNLIIVDDEDIILNGLSKYINWSALGFHLVGTAHSTTEALDLISLHPVDVVLTDIRMEFESGLDLIEKLSQDYPAIKTVILSGYEEFEYARRAMRYGTFDFLTKPVNFDNLYKTFTRLKEVLECESATRQGHEAFLELRKSIFLNNLIREAIPLDLALAKQLHMNVSAQAIQLVRLRLENCTDYVSVKAHLNQMLETKFVLDCIYLKFNSALNEVSLVIYNTTETQLITSLEAFMQSLSFPLTAGLSLPFNHLSRLHIAYFQSGKALDYRIIKRNSYIIPFSEIENILYVSDVLPHTLREKVLNCLLLKDTELLKTLIVDELEHINEHSDSLNLIYSFCIELFLIIYGFLKNHHANLIHDELHDLIKNLILREHADAIKTYMVDYIDNQKHYILEISPCSTDIIKTAQNYIQEHYAENLTLNTLADFLFIHPIYLSKLFKERTGQNFIDYLTDIRIEKAKELLTQTHFKIYDISEMVGYESSKYFSKLFKDIVGVTPKAYRSPEQS